MAIVKVMGGALARQPNSGPPAKAATHAVAKHAAKHVAKHAAKKHAAKKHAAKKHAAKKHAAKHVESALKLPAGMRDRIEGDEAELGMAFHHMNRASAVISLLEAESGGDLRALLEHGIQVYRGATASKRAKGSVRCAFGLLRAAEHLGMAGLYAARRQHRVDANAVYRTDVQHHLDTLGTRLDGLSPKLKEHGERLKQMARELLKQAETANGDPHLEYELTMAADGICSALEAGL
jgi:hypothetical protein